MRDLWNKMKEGDRTLIRFIPLAGISFLLAFNYFILRALKDTLLVTAQNAGAEAIPFVKVWLLLPSSFVLASGFAWLTSRYSFRFAFTTIILFFLFSFSLFSFVLFPYRDALHPTHLANQLVELLPQGWHALAAILNYWTFAYFYVMAENWSTIVYSVLFWGFANEITKLSDAKRYYPLLTLAGTASALVAGPVGVYLSADRFNPLFPFGQTAWEQSLYSLTFLILGCGLAAVLLFLYVVPHEVEKVVSSPKRKLSLLDSFRFLVRSNYLLSIAFVSLTYNMMINLSEVVWKSEILKVYPNPSEYNTYTNHVTTMTGLVATLITVFGTRSLLKHFGWTKTALITPLIALGTGVLFYTSIFLDRMELTAISISSIAFLGSCHICLSCSGKYTLFDTTKELAFIPLSSQEKLHGKAAIDGVGSRLGKAGSSLFLQSLLVVFPTISACTPFISLFLGFFLIICIRSILSLGEQMESAPISLVKIDS